MVDEKIMKKKKARILFAQIKTKEELIQKLLEEDITLDDFLLEIEMDEVDIHNAKMLRELKKMAKKRDTRYIA